MNRIFPALMFFTVFSFFSAHGELAPESREDASHIVVGEVTEVFKSEGEEYITYIVKIHVEAAEKGEGPKKGRSFFVECFERKPHEGGRELAPGASGHSGVPKVGERVRVFTNQRNWHCVEAFPNWGDLRRFLGAAAGGSDAVDAEVSGVFKTDRRENLVAKMVQIRLEAGNKEDAEGKGRYLYAEYFDHKNDEDADVPKVGERLRVFPFEGRSVYEGVYPNWYDVLWGDEKAAELDPSSRGDREFAPFVMGLALDDFAAETNDKGLITRVNIHYLMSFPENSKISERNIYYMGQVLLDAPIRKGQYEAIRKAVRKHGQHEVFVRFTARPSGERENWFRGSYIGYHIVANHERERFLQAIGTKGEADFPLVTTAVPAGSAAPDQKPENDRKPE